MRIPDEFTNAQQEATDAIPLSDPMFDALFMPAEFDQATVPELAESLSSEGLPT